MELRGRVDVTIQPACVIVFLLCPVWTLFLLFNIIGSSPAWFVSKKKLGGLGLATVTKKHKFSLLDCRGGGHVLPIFPTL